MSAEVTRYTDPALNGRQYGGRPLSEAEKAKAKEEILRDLKPMLVEFAQLNADLNRQEIQLYARKKELATKKQELAAEKQELAAEKQELAARKAANDRSAAEAKRILKETCVTVFYRIFHGLKSTAPVEEIDMIFQKYMADNPITAITVEDASGATDLLQLKSMKGIVQYLADHPALKQIDFRPFKAEISDIPTLSAYLAANNCSIKAVAMKECLAVAEKENLKSAAAARNGALKIQYFA